MPDLSGTGSHASPHENLSQEARRLAALQKSFGKIPHRLPSDRGGDQGDDAKGSYRGLGSEPKATLYEWHEFAHSQGDLDLTGKREFDSDLERVDTIIQEEQGLYLFARIKGLDGTAILADLDTKAGKKTAGSEHIVFFDPTSNRVYKLTREGKYGRIADTPTQYLDRLALMNAITPELEIRFEDFVKNKSGEPSFLTSMAMFKGKNPTPKKVDVWLQEAGFISYSDGSGTLDYIHHESGIIFRDCHVANWKESKGLLVPIDIIPEWARQE